MKRAHVTHQAGLTLVEMMVALLITTVLLGGIVSIFASSKQSHKLTDSLGFMQESGRIAINVISTDLRRTGYLGGNKDVAQMAGGTLAPLAPAAGTYDDCNTAGNTWALMLTQRLFGLNDTKGGYNCIPASGTPTGYAQGDVLAVRYVNAQDTTAAQLAASPNDLFVRSTLAAGRVFLGSAQANAANQLVGTPLAVYPLVANAYYIGTSADTCNGDAIPALYQVTIGANGAPSEREIVAGIEDLQVQYGWDTDGDSIANRYLDADDAALATFTNWNYAGIPAANTIVSVRIWLMARAACQEHVSDYNNSNSYTYGDQIAVIHNDKYRRQLYSATIALRN